MSAKRPRIYRRSMPVQSLSLPLHDDPEMGGGTLAGGTVHLKQSLCYSVKAYAERPEVALMRAVLADALDCFQKQFRSGEREDQRLAQEAEEWFFSDDYNCLFSFVHICAVLGLDPEYVRRGLKRWRHDRSREKLAHSAS